MFIRHRMLRLKGKTPLCPAATSSSPSCPDRGSQEPPSRLQQAVAEILVARRRQVLLQPALGELMGAPVDQRHVAVVAMDVPRPARARGGIQNRDRSNNGGRRAVSTLGAEK